MKTLAKPAERERALAALELRKTGLTYAEIGRRLGYADDSGARHAVTKLLDRREAEAVAELRQVEGDRLDALQAAHWSAAVSGDTEATKVVLQVIDARCRLYGLNSPVAVAVSTGPGTAAEVIAEAQARLLRVIDAEQVTR